ncbi:MAG: cobyric acid synthase [Alphaproteobacteria bacterium]|nr:cobyric acid synthase [Alphaproteobacteria bacterium]
MAKAIKALMFQGTGSDVGKSLMVAGLARAYANRGLSVRPFKPQNMSNNAAIAGDGGEIGRAQHLQALAARAVPSVHMNPVLLKPQTDIGAQIIVRGRVRGAANAREYQHLKAGLLEEVLESYRINGSGADLVLVEGAGSPAEINLPGRDIANMGFAGAANVPVILVADIDRGGVIASIVGTHAVIADDARARIRGYVINKFRGDVSLFDTGLQEISERTGWPSLGIAPYFPDAVHLPAEDAVVLDKPAKSNDGAILIAVPKLSRIANFDDLDPLNAESDAEVRIIAPGDIMPVDADLILLPGSKATIADLAFLRRQGWDIDILSHYRRGGHILGICGGYQMLGRTIADPNGIEGSVRKANGLGLLDIETVLSVEKSLGERTGKHVESGEALHGYEIHLGHSDGPDRARPFLKINGVADGARSTDGRVEGCYLHGLFRADGFRHAYLSALRARAQSGINHHALVDRTLDGLAAHLEDNLDLDCMLEIAHAA